MERQPFQPPRAFAGPAGGDGDRAKSGPCNASGEILEGGGIEAAARDQDDHVACPIEQELDPGVAHLDLALR
jgi:hypothetical protein